MMKRTLAVLAVALILATPNILAQSNNSGQSSKPEAPQVPGVRKLSRRERRERISKLSDKYRKFLEDVEPIMLPEELDTFLLLDTDPQRDLYIDDFWHRRDVEQGTTNHTFKDDYYERLQTAKEQFKNISSDRARIYLIHGAPTDMIDSDCQLLVPLQVWKYAYIPNFGHDVRFLFYKPRLGIDYRLWIPYGIGNTSLESMAELVSEQQLGTDLSGNGMGAVQYVFGPVGPGSSETNIEFQCKDGDEIEKAIYQSQLNSMDLGKLFEPPKINEEDVHKILRSVVLADPGAPKLDADFSIAFPAKQGSRTDAQMTLEVPRAQLTSKDVGGTRMFSLDVIGEILKDGELYENYHYKFDYPAAIRDPKIAAVVDRFLFPANYTARLKIQDQNSGAEAIVEKKISVPELMDTPEQAREKEIASRALSKLKDDIESNATHLRIVPLPNDLLVGLQHVDTITFGNDIKSVQFFLDGKKVMEKTQPPYDLDLDLGDVPRVHSIRAIALDEKGEPITGDEITVNGGNEPFRVHIVSPRVALNVHGPTRVEMSVHVPENKKLDKLQLFLNETPVATLFGPPYVTTVDIPLTQGVGYLRAVATLKDDPAQPPIEDLVMINTPQFMQQVNVHLVELPTTVMNHGHPVNNLPESAFKVLDEGKPVKVAKFEYVNNLHLSLGMAIDTSASMQPRMDEARKAASGFLTSVMRTGDRAFLVSFDTEPELIQQWSSHLADVNAGLAKLRAEESTALYDAIVYSLYNFVGVQGQKALIVVTDGRDTASKFSWDQAIEYARREGVPIYAIGINIHGTDVDVKYKLGKFCSETGGEAYYIDAASDLPRIYKQIETELRSQYILGFYPGDDVKPGSKWHEVSVQVSEGRARTIRGYYP